MGIDMRVVEMSKAVLKGNVELAKKAYSNMSKRSRRNLAGILALRAAELGHANLLKWMRDDLGWKITGEPLVGAAKSNHNSLETVQLIWETDPWESQEFAREAALAAARKPSEDASWVAVWLCDAQTAYWPILERENAAAFKRERKMPWVWANDIAELGAECVLVCPDCDDPKVITPAELTEEEEDPIPQTYHANCRRCGKRLFQVSKVPVTD